jgi:hypothetical protein
LGQLLEKYKENFDVSSEGPLLGTWMDGWMDGLLHINIAANRLNYVYIYKLRKY